MEAHDKNGYEGAHPHFEAQGATTRSRVALDFPLPGGRDPAASAPQSNSAIAHPPTTRKWADPSHSATRDWQDMNAKETALILIGFQNDYFAPDGALHAAVGEEMEATQILPHTLDVLNRLKDTPVTLIHTPILFSADYSELPNPAGLMGQIRDLGAFRRGTRGGETIPEIRQFGNRIVTVDGKTGFNAFGGTSLAQVLEERQIKNVVILGVVTSICVDSTGRAASEYGYNVTFLSDCHAGRSRAEHEFYSKSIFPLYADVKESDEFLAELR